MRTIEEVMGACRIDDEGCWIWGASTSAGGLPRIFAPDWTRAGGEMTIQNGRRGVWHIATGQALPEKWQAFCTCGKKLCMNPQCIEAGPKSRQGTLAARAGWLKGKTQTRIAARRTGRARSVLTPELIAEIQASDETGLALAARLKVSSQTVSKARRGEIVAFQPVGGLFAGLTQVAR